MLDGITHVTLILRLFVPVSFFISISIVRTTTSTVEPHSTVPKISRMIPFQHMDLPVEWGTAVEVDELELSATVVYSRGLRVLLADDP
jgi:hypothetical protein